MTTPPREESETPRSDDIRLALLEKYPLAEHLGMRKTLYYMEAAELYALECAGLEHELAAALAAKQEEYQRGFNDGAAIREQELVAEREKYGTYILDSHSKNS